jgi:aryl-alcohol dehydrogenase-like predicted oxidoreductase
MSDMSNEEQRLRRLGLTVAEWEVLEALPTDIANILYGHIRTTVTETEVERAYASLTERGLIELDGITVFPTEDGRSLTEAW